VASLNFVFDQPVHTRSAAFWKTSLTSVAKYCLFTGLASQALAAVTYAGYVGAFAWKSVDVVSQVARSVAALRFLLCEDTIHTPPPTLPVAAVVSPSQVSGPAAAIWPAGILNAESNRYLPYHDGPLAISTLLPVSLAKPWLKKPCVLTVLFAISLSSSPAIRVQFLSARSTLSVVGCTSWNAGHWLDQKYDSCELVSPMDPTR
jgi:hypothetical protein